jgi:hypothetical protein
MRTKLASALAASLLFTGLAFAQPRVYSVPLTQGLRTPTGSINFQNASAVAITGDSIIIMDGAALLYRRAASGQWAYSRTLVADPGTSGPRDVAMKNNLAIIKVGATSTIWENVNGNWQQAPTAAPITAPGKFAISLNRIMVGADGCTADALIYQKNTSTGIWDVTGRIPAEDGTCANTPRPVELNYDHALVRGTTNVLRSYQRNGTALVWPNAGNIALTGAAAEFPDVAPALQGGTLVLNDLSYYRRTSSGWSRVNRLVPLNYPNGAGDSGRAIYRDNVLLVTDAPDGFQVGRTPYIYLKNSQGNFDHVGIIGNPSPGPSTGDFDISGRTVVQIAVNQRGSIINELVVYTLPEDLPKPRAIVNNFEARDISNFSTTAGSEYALAGNSSNYIFRQSNQTADTAAVLNDSDWTDYQRVHAILKPNAFSRADAWLGLAVRYVDENNYYFVSLGNDDVVRLQRKLNGVVTTLAQASHPIPIGTWKSVTLTAQGSRVFTSVTGLSAQVMATDTALTHGSAALLTSGARADFDNLDAKSTPGFTVFSEEPPFLESRRDYTIVGGNWQSGNFPSGDGLRQSDTSGEALAIQGLPMDDQSIEVDVTLDTFASANPTAWYGVVLRYVDADNFYYFSVRSSGQVQIRKVVNGVGAVLKAANFSVVPGDSQRLYFSAIGNELMAIVEGELLIRAVDDDLPRGRFGLGTNRAGATYRYISASQP